MLHNSEKWMDGVSIMNGLFDCVSQVNHEFLLVFQFSMHVSHYLQIDGGCSIVFHKIDDHFNNLVVSFP